MSQIENKNQEKKVLLDRLWVSLVAIPVVVIVIWLGSYWFTLLAVAWGLGAVHEFYQIIHHSGKAQPLIYFGMLWTGLMIVSPHFTSIPRMEAISPLLLILITGVVFSLLILLWRPGKENAFAGWSWTMGGVLYIGLLLGCMVALRNLDNGLGWVFLAVLCTFASDSSAYLVGRKLGKHKLAPYISPKKSWEGAIAGVGAAIIFSFLVALFFALPLNHWQVILIGLLVSVMGQLGDLVKSLFKRNMEIKDSGHVLPGHGGFMDRMDSLAFAGVTVFLFALLVI
jgi:phosphatidate cytidylyltransferase